jgi:hypothetical protein
VHGVLCKRMWNVQWNYFSGLVGFEQFVPMVKDQQLTEDKLKEKFCGMLVNFWKIKMHAGGLKH